MAMVILGGVVAATLLNLFEPAPQTPDHSASQARALS
jgi:hypothetical protein